MSYLQRYKRIHPTARFWGRGVMAAHRTFNPARGGSSPSGPTWLIADLITSIRNESGA
jgi:hypothetical protein